MLLDRGDSVVGVDNMNTYYDVQLKEGRLNELKPYNAFTFEREDITNGEYIRGSKKEAPDRIIHLAAQAGVRYSLENPHAYVDANVTGF